MLSPVLEAGSLIYGFVSESGVMAWAKRMGIFTPWQIRQGALVGGAHTLKHSTKVILFLSESREHRAAVLRPAPLYLNTFTTEHSTRARGIAYGQLSIEHRQQDVIRIGSAEMNVLCPSVASTVADVAKSTVHSPGGEWIALNRCLGSLKSPLRGMKSITQHHYSEWLMNSQPRSAVVRG